MTRTPALLATIALLLATGCGDDPPAAPTQLDAGDVNAALARVMDSCQDGPATDQAAQRQRRQDVERMIAVYHDTDPDARFQLVDDGESTTMRDLLEQTRDVLAAGFSVGCSDNLAADIDAALKTG